MPHAWPFPRSRAFVGVFRRGACLLASLVCTLACGSALAAPAAPPAASPDLGAALCFAPADWVGRYPTDKDASGRTFLKLPCVARQLRALLPAAKLKRFLGALTVQGPIEQEGKYLAHTACRPHDCPSDHAMLVIDLERSRFFVGLYLRRRPQGSITEWYASDGDPSELPAEIVARFSHQHQPAP